MTDVLDISPGQFWHQRYQEAELERQNCLRSRRKTVAGVKTEVDVAWMRFEESSVAGKWRTDNPGEYAQIKEYRISDGHEPTDIETDFGLGLLALVKAGKIGDGTYQLAQDDL